MQRLPCCKKTTLTFNLCVCHLHCTTYVCTPSCDILISVLKVKSLDLWNWFEDVFWYISSPITVNTLLANYPSWPKNDNYSLQSSFIFFQNQTKNRVEATGFESSLRKKFDNKTNFSRSYKFLRAKITTTSESIMQGHCHKHIQTVYWVVRIFCTLQICDKRH